MTQEQKKVMSEIVTNLNTTRKQLDYVMYYSEPITDKEFGKVRECYDELCNIIDKLYKL